MASSQSSSGSSPAGHDSSLDQDQAGPKPQLETLVSHLVAAKRSLSSINHVWRANEIVTTARSSLEESVVVSARTGFLRRGLNNQLRLLYGVRAEVEEVSHRGRAGFQSVLKELDAADARLKETLNTLRETIVHSAFRPEGEDPKSLHDFVDERGVEELQTSLKESIDRTNAAQARLDESNYAFDDELRHIQEALERYRVATKLASSRSPASSSSSSATSNANLPSPAAMPAMLRSLESHAQEMADLLESLVRHFDLCVTAVKHTEGGGAAARSITGDMPNGVHVGVGVGDEIEDVNSNAALEPLSDSEYHEMLNVLTKDAAEAEDVVLEIQDHIGDMESILENLLTQHDAILTVSNATTDIFQHLSSLASTRLPNYIAQAHEFTRVWSEENERIRAGMSDISDLRSLYLGFLDAYDGLILEVSRRKHVRQGVEKILREARAKLDQLYEEDVNAREAFRVEQGDYLPSDIWPGVGREPMRIEFLRLSGGGEGPETAASDENPDAGDYIPNLPKQFVEEAITRLQARAKGTMM